MLPYHISMYWANHTYVQKILNANISLPRSCTCSLVTISRLPWFFRYTTHRRIRLIPLTKAEANVYQLNMVEYQCASMLMIHIHGVVLICVSAYTNRKPAPHFTVFQYILVLFLGAVSCASDNARNLRPKKDHRAIVTSVKPTNMPGFRKLFLPSRILSPCGVIQ